MMINNIQQGNSFKANVFVKGAKTGQEAMKKAGQYIQGKPACIFTSKQGILVIDANTAKGKKISRHIQGGRIYNKDANLKEMFEETIKELANLILKHKEELTIV